jgi:hypothetical protein
MALAKQKRCAGYKDSSRIQDFFSVFYRGKKLRPKPLPYGRGSVGLGLNYVDAHTTAGALHLLDGCVYGEAVEIGHFQFGDLFDLL